MASRSLATPRGTEAAQAARSLGITAGILTLLGIFSVYTASTSEALAMTGDPFFLIRQHLVRVVVGIMGFSAIQYVPLSFWKKLSPFGYVACLVALVVVFLPGIGLELNGAHRWVSLGGVVIQPIEIVKLSLTLFFATWLTPQKKAVSFAFLVGCIALLVIAQPDLGSLLLILMTTLGQYFMAGGKLQTLGMFGAAGVVFVLIAVLLSPYRLQRLTTYLDPHSDPLGASFHIRQIILGLGNGGWLGQGLGQSKQKYAYIPEPSTDSIFAIVSEEVGFVGSVAILALFGYFWRCGTTILKALPLESFESKWGWGVLIWIGGQVLLNISAVVALVPLTGVPLPFFSYGGSSLVMIWLGTGILVKLASSVEGATRSSHRSTHT
jgi:cell division protein FtsW